MIISPGRKFIFVHIPKTGGTSLALALEDRAMKDDILIGDTPKAQRRRDRLKSLTPAGRLWKHSTLADINGVVDPADHFVFTIVRNPWDRAVSYYHWLQTQTFNHPAVGRAKSLGFADFINHEATKQGFKSQSYGGYVTDSAGGVRCDLFARLETLDDDLHPLWDHLGFVCKVGRANASARKRDWRPYYTDADAAVIGDVCEADIAAFGYRFDPTG
jgi:putative transposase